MTTTNMSLNEPSVGVTAGPDWATQVNENFQTIDTHDHTSGKGVQLTPSALNINADLEFNQNSATELKNVIFDSSVTAATTSYSVYQSGGNLYWRNGSGTAVQITSGSGINTSGGSISGMTGNAQVQFSNVNNSYTFKFDSTFTDGIAKVVVSDLQLYFYNSGSATTRSVNLKYTGSGTGSNTLTVPDETGTLLSTATSFAGAIFVGATGGSGSITLDAQTDINLDSDSGVINFKDGGTAIGKISNSSSDLVIENEVDAKDIIFKQYDGNEVVRMADDRRLYFYDKGGEYIYGDGTDLNINSGAAINLNAGTLDLSAQTVDVTLNNAVDALNFDSNTLSIDASNNRIGLGTAAPDELLHLKSSTSLNPVIKIENTNADHLNPQINFVKNTGSPAADDYLGQVDFDGTNSSAALKTYGRLQCQAKDVSNTSEDARVYIAAMNNGTLEQTFNVVSGKVGINQTGPASLLTVGSVADNNSANTPLGKVAQDPVILINNSSHVNSESQLLFGYNSGSETYAPVAISYKNTSASSKGKGDLLFATRDATTDSAPTERMRIKSDGDVEVKTGNLVIGTAGKGIDFSAASATDGMAGEVLEHVERGTYTPFIANADGTNKTTPSETVYGNGRYSKIGNVCHVWFNIKVGINSVTDRLYVSLPITSDNDQSATTGTEGFAYPMVNSANNIHTGSVNSASTVCSFVNASGASLTCANMSDSFLYVYTCYQTAD